MITLKKRSQSTRLTVLSFLSKRMHLPKEEKQTLYNLEKGFIGETAFDSVVKKCIGDNLIVLNDLVLIISGTTVQIDSLLLTGDGLYLYEIKNYHGTYQDQLTHFETTFGRKIDHPLNQLNRTTLLVEKLLEQWRINVTVKPYLVFINPEFTLYEASITQPFLMPSQIKSHLTQMSHRLPPITKKERRLGERLLLEHKTEAAFQKKMIHYTYDSLKSGVNCPSCGSFKISRTLRRYMCDACRYQNSIQNIIIEKINEFRVLFPDMRVTTSMIEDWCGHTIAKKTIRNVLKRHFRMMKHGHVTYYE